MAHNPRIGVILIQPFSKDQYATYNWILSAGIHIVPILPTIGKIEAVAYFNQIHGLYLPPGDPGDYTGLEDNIRIGKIFLNLALKANKQNKYFPVWGTCMGLQQMVSHFGSVKLNQVNSVNHRQSLIRSDSPSRMLGKHHIKGNVQFNHTMGLSPIRFQSSKKLRELFTIIATTYDMDGFEYISILEGKEYPFYGVQFHQESMSSLDWLKTFLRQELLKHIM